MTTAGPGSDIPVLPNELLLQVIGFTDRSDLGVFLFVCRFTYTLVCQRVYRKAVFPDDTSSRDILQFCDKYGQSLQTIKLPQQRYYPDTFLQLLMRMCPNLTFLQSSITPKQVHAYRLQKPDMTFVTSTGYYDHTDDDMETFDCCSSSLVFPTNASTDHTAMTHISHYFHHPGALRNGILPTYGTELLSLTLNRYDVLTASVAKLIIAKCPRLRYLVAPTVRAAGLWMILRWCDTLAAVIVGLQDDEEDVFNDEENEKAVATIAHYKRVWCVHSNHFDDHRSWHIGIIPRK
ncbi:hypothetical protein BJV82DRAFT_616539 [Fennellomyces sp. T-0311]|nr:hypothetical protein BJV82DRAFT_616539 [Fennellomyces sp. T-0311]